MRLCATPSLEILPDDEPGRGDHQADHQARRQFSHLSERIQKRNG